MSNETYPSAHLHRGRPQPSPVRRANGGSCVRSVVTESPRGSAIANTGGVLAIDLLEVGPCEDAKNADTFQATAINGTEAHALEKPHYRGIPVWKRAIDVVVSGSLLILLSPLFVVVAAWIKLGSRGPVFFCQQRIGAGGELFTIYKFRTMQQREGASQQHRQYIGNLVSSDEPIEKPRHCKHLIRGGKWMRSLSIDELPQLFNVFVGTMSLVGPRPDVLSLDDYQAWHLRRFEVRPGITGLWQVSGKNRLTFRQMMELDIRYVDACTLSHDCLIMAKTLIVLLRRDNE